MLALLGNLKAAYYFLLSRVFSSDFPDEEFETHYRLNRDLSLTLYSLASDGGYKLPSLKQPVIYAFIAFWEPLNPSLMPSIVAVKVL